MIEEKEKKWRDTLINAFKLLSIFFYEKKTGFLSTSGVGSLVEDDSMNVDDATR